jgi:hypothetical protein
MTAAEDDERVGRLFRLLRQRASLTQEEVAIATAIPVKDLRALESGHISLIRYGRARRLFAELEARARLSVWWNGAAADRLLDEEHAALVERGAVMIAGYSWMTPTEISFAEFGERGSIDIFAHREEAQAVAVCEIKSAFGSLEELNRTLDMKVRLAPRICSDRFGWTPHHVGRLLLVPDVSSTRRVVAAHRQTMNALYPACAAEIRRWLRKPDGNIAGIWFVSDPPNTPPVPPPEP